ncbi:hypothetical protein N9V04_01805 [Bacteroidota bacterium]|nr:hypothetical protein [Bacteroidota bacterium]
MELLDKHINALKKTILAQKNLVVSFHSSPYGDECSLIDFMGEDSVAEKLEISVRYLDQYYHDHNEIEKGTSREYEIIIEDNHLLAKVKYGWDYSYGSKWWENDLEEILKNKVVIFLSKITGTRIEKFDERFYFDIQFSSDSNHSIDSFSLIENEVEIGVSHSAWGNLKKEILDLSYKYGANTREANCEFDFHLTSDDSYILEKWVGEINFS